jgi:hypothetical protein
VNQPSIARAKASPRTVAQLEEELELLDSVLLGAQRGRNAARTKIPSLMASGDQPGIEECRQEIARLDAQIVDFTERRGQTQDAIRAVEARDRSAFSRKAYDEIFRQSAKFKDSLGALEDACAAFGAALLATLKQQDVLEGTQRSSGCRVDPDSVHIKLLGLVEQNLYLSSDGLCGKLRSLSSPHELRQSKQASLKRLAAQHHELTLRQARNALGISAEPPNEAA